MSGEVVRNPMPAGCRKAALIAGATLAIGALAACGSAGEGGSPPSTSTVTSVKTVVETPAPVTITASPTVAASTVTTSAAPAKETEARTTAAHHQSWVMPNEVGKDLQAAQDDIQALTNDGIWYTDSSDATGQSRMQIIDRNWKVCSQNVAPGTTITASTEISFAAVKLTETCP